MSFKVNRERLKRLRGVLSHHDGSLFQGTRWIRRGGFAVLDQGLFAGANFIVNILLARWLEPVQYGAFAVAYSVFLLLAAFHTAVLTEPMIVFGAGKYAERFRKYLGILIYGHWGITVAIAVVLGLLALAFWQLGSEDMAQALAGLAIASPFVLLLWLVRGASYARLQPQWATTGSVSFLVLVLTGIYGIHKIHAISSLSALFIMGAAGFIGSWWPIVLLRPEWQLGSNNPTLEMVLVDHWRYGKWNLLAVGLFWLSGEILNILVPAFLGLEAMATIAAIGNLFKPLHPFTQSMTNLMLPFLARSFAETRSLDRARELKRTTVLFLALCTGVVSLYGISMILVAIPLFNFLYKGQYGGQDLVYLLSLSYIASAVNLVFTSSIKAMGNTRIIFYVWSVSSAIMVFFAIPAMVIGGLSGALWTLVFSYWIAAFMAWKYFHKMLRVL